MLSWYFNKIDNTHLFLWETIARFGYEVMTSLCVLTVCFGIYTTPTNISMKYLMMCKVYTDVGGIK